MRLLDSLFLIIIKYSKMYLNCITIIFGSVLFISLYSLLNKFTFFCILYVILFFAKFVIISRALNFNFTNKFISLIVNRDYSQYLQRFVLIKFFLFYIYLTSDYMYCESIWSKFAHDVFVGVGNSVGIKPTTTVSTLESIGIISVVAGISLGSIHLYNWSTGKTKRSIDDRLNFLENQLYLNNQNLNYIHNNLKTSQQDYADVNAAAFTVIGRTIHEISNNTDVLNQKIDICSNQINNLGTLYVEKQKATENYIDINVNSKLTRIESKLVNFANSSDLTEQDRNNLLEIQQEFNNLNNNLQNIPKSSQLNLLDPTSVLTPGATYKAKVLPGSVTFNYLSELGIETKKIHNRSNSFNPSKLEHKQQEFTSEQHKQRVSFIIENNRIKHVSLEDVLNSTPSIMRSLGTKLVNNFPQEFVLKTISTALVNTLSGSISIAVFNGILKTFGFSYPFSRTDNSQLALALPSPQSGSEKLGNTITTSILDFLRGLRNGTGL